MGIEHEIQVAPIHLDGRIDGAIDVVLVGEFDLSTAEELHHSFLSPEVRDARRVQVDLRAVSFIDSVTISLLVSLCKRVRSPGGTFSIRCGDGQVLRILQISGLADYFEIQILV